MERFPVGALLRDPRNPAATDIHVVSSEGEHVLVSIGGATRQYKRNEMRMQRWLLPVRTRVAVLGSNRHEPIRGGIVVGVHGVTEPATTWSYVVQMETGPEVLSEQRLQVLKIETNDPLERLESNGWRGPRRFFGRLGLLERTTVWKHDSEGIPAFLGARVEPLFHQFYAARRVLTDREQRFLLADEVGLGKTIEAGLVIQSLLASKQDLRVLVVAPGTTSRQWLSELYSRFGARVFTHVDAVRYEHGDNGRGIGATARDALLRRDLLIVTTSLLRVQPKALARVAEQTWDLLVIDEGHHLPNWPELAASLRRISARASGCLVLTATPGRGDERGLLELLRIVAPSTYESVTEQEFAARLVPQREILEKLHYSEELVAALIAHGEIGADDARELAGQWQGLFPNDRIVAERLERMQRGDGEAAEELVAHVQENYRADRRIIRTRRKTLGAYGTQHAARVVEHLAYDPCPYEVEVVQHVEMLAGRADANPTWRAIWSRLACSTPRVLEGSLKTRLAAIRHGVDAVPLADPLEADLGPAEEEAALEGYLAQGTTFRDEAFWLEGALALTQQWGRSEPEECARFASLRAWVKERLRVGRPKIVVFAQLRPVAEELAGILRVHVGRDAVALSNHRMGDDEIAEVSRKFQKDPRCLVLVSDELGAEGRNFQFADAVVHLDQPWLVARIEQRIGRLDRIGREADRPVLSVAVVGPMESEVALFELHRDVFRVYERSIGGLEYLLPRIQQRVHSAVAGGAQTLRKLGAELGPELRAEESRIDEAFTFFLDATRPELERAKELAELVAERTGDEDKAFLRAWCKELNVDVIPQEENRYKVEVHPDRLDSPLSMLGNSNWVRTGTFLREAALENEAIQYFAPGHVFVDALLANAHDTQDARASAFFRGLGAKGSGRVFALVVGRLEPDASAWPAGFAPGLRRRAEQYLPAEWVRMAWEIQPDGEIALVQPGPLLEGLHRDFEVADRKCQPEHIGTIHDRYPGLWVGVRSAAASAKIEILRLKKRELDESAADLADDLRSELAYLRARKGNVMGANWETELGEREALLASIREPSVTLDSVAVIVGSGTH